MRSRFGRETLTRSTRTPAIVLSLTLAALFASDAFGAAANGTGQVNPKAFPGYTLIAPMMSTTTTLVDLEGNAVHTWEHDCSSASVTYLLENGNLLRAGMAGGGGRGGGRGFGGGRGGGMGFGGGGDGGRVQEVAWDGEVLWDYTFATDTHLLHHDIEKLPNGNVLMIAWERKSANEAIAAGRNRRMQSGSDLRPDFVIEVKPTGKTTGEIVWEWHMWDHLIQDYDETKENYGDVAAHPELIDINFSEGWAQQLSDDQADSLRSLGYLGPAPGRGGGGFGGMGGGADWTHTNAIDYNADLDQIMISIHGFGEFWILDHSTTTEEAAGHTGGRYGKGGDILYRWGNPAAYRAGKLADRRLFGQHDSQWIPEGYPGAGHILVFNNGVGRPQGNYSTVDEVVIPVAEDGSYPREEGKAFGPGEAVWSYSAPRKNDLFSMAISGAQRLPNGNTLICAGMGNGLTEVTADNEIVWRYTGSGGGGGPAGMPGFGGGVSGPDFQPTFRGGRGGGRDGGRGPGGMGGPGGMPGMGGPGGMGGFGGMMGMGGVQLFRAYRYGADYPGLKDKGLTLNGADEGAEIARGDD